MTHVGIAEGFHRDGGKQALETWERQPQQQAKEIQLLRLLLLYHLASLACFHEIMKRPVIIIRIRNVECENKEQSDNDPENNMAIFTYQMLLQAMQRCLFEEPNQTAVICETV